MKSLFQFAFAFVVMLSLLAPANAFAARHGGGGHTRTQSYHDRTPTVHVRDSHRRHG